MGKFIGNGFVVVLERRVGRRRMTPGASAARNAKSAICAHWIPRRAICAALMAVSCSSRGYCIAVGYTSPVGPRGRRQTSSLGRTIAAEFDQLGSSSHRPHREPKLSSPAQVGNRTFCGAVAS